jgi:hypothetical protein
MRTHYRLRTAPAPWTEEEQWRDHRRRRDDDDDDEGDQPVVFEKEAATIPEPAELDVWVSLPPEVAASAVGVGFRARWAEVGDGSHAWWTFKPKDCGSGSRKFS